MKKYNFNELVQTRLQGQEEFYVAHEVDALLTRCLSALEDDKNAAAEAFDKNAGWPGRQQQMQQWVSDSAALYAEVTSLMGEMMQQYDFTGHLTPLPPGLKLPLQISGKVYLVTEVDARIAELELALNQIINSVVDENDEALAYFRLGPEEIRKLARSALGK